MIRRIFTAWRDRRERAALARSSRDFQRGWAHGMNTMRGAEDKAKEAAALRDCTTRERAFGTYNEFDKGVEGAVEEFERQQRLLAARKDAAQADYDGISRAQYKAMFHSACEDIADITLALGLDEAKGVAPLLAVIAELRARRPAPDDAELYEVMAECTMGEGDGTVLDHLKFARAVLARWGVQEPTDDAARWVEVRDRFDRSKSSRSQLVLDGLGLGHADPYEPFEGIIDAARAPNVVQPEELSA